MDAQQVLAAGQQGLTVLLMVAAPVLGVVLVAGLVVSIFQKRGASARPIPACSPSPDRGW